MVTDPAVKSARPRATISAPGSWSSAIREVYRSGDHVASAAGHNVRVRITHGLPVGHDEGIRIAEDDGLPTMPYICPMPPTELQLTLSQVVVQVCLFIVAAIAILGGSLQMYLGQPSTSARLDNVHRFMAGVYLSTGIIAGWAAVTIRQQGTLVYLLALGVFLAGCGRLLSISKVGLPQPRAVWLGYLIPELLIPVVMALAHRASTSG